MGAAHIVTSSFVLFTDTPTPEIYTLSLHDALPICSSARRGARAWPGRSSNRWKRGRVGKGAHGGNRPFPDRKSTRLNSSHGSISYAVFCLKKKNKSRRCT